MARSLGSRLKEARERKRFTQVDVAKKIGISNGTLSGYERDYRDPDTSTLRKLAALYEVSVDWLTGASNDRTPVSNETINEARPYEGIMREIKEKYPGVDISDPDIQRKLMKVIDLVLDDYEKK